MHEVGSCRKVGVARLQRTVDVVVQAARALDRAALAMARQTRARSVPPERFWISEARVALPQAPTMTRWNSTSMSMKACVVSALSMRSRHAPSSSSSASESRGVASPVAAGSRMRRT